jgi:AbrB family looped-hinge helix DNA binding protein
MYKSNNMKTERSLRKIARGYQITLPPEFRDEFHLNVGDYVEVSEENGRLIIEPVEIKKKNIASQFDDIFKNQKDRLITSEDKILEMVRKEVKLSRKEK